MFLPTYLNSPQVRHVLISDETGEDIAAILASEWALHPKLLHKPNDQADTRKLDPPDKEWFLANVPEDAGERTNLAPRHPEIVERLRKLAPVGTE